MEELQYIFHRPQTKYRSRTVAVITLRAQYCRPDALLRETLSIAGALMLFEAILIIFILHEMDDLLKSGGSSIDQRTRAACAGWPSRASSSASQESPCHFVMSR